MTQFFSTLPSQSIAESAAFASHASSTLPSITRQSALFLDFDGTLVDIASQPDLVVVPDGLADLLANVSRELDGALAIVSGRGLQDLDHYLAPLSFPAAAEHGAVQRNAGGDITHAAVPYLHDIERVALALVSEQAGLRIEIKSAAISLHYRHAPQLEELCLIALAEAVKRTPGVELIHGKCVFEVKPAGVSKGSAIQAFMAQSGFIGRQPIFAGDDTTDESGFPVVQAMGGHGIKVGPGGTLADFRCANPAALREWLQAFVEACNT